ncbi:MAG: hypothetical protein Q8M26_05285 [Pseudolabrys sp.]|nr:hypothetical protein [Pseudolabrys sp.]
MQIHRTLISALAAAATAAIAHLVFSAAAAYTMASYDKRIFDVRRFPDARDYPALIGGYLVSRGTSGKTVVAGSSFSFGYPFAADLAPAALMDHEPMNASIIGLGLQGVRSIVLCEMRARRLRASHLVVEVPLINEIAALKVYNKPSRGCTESSSGHPTLLRYAIGNPIGLHWAEILTDPYRRATQSAFVSVASVADDYFASAEQFASVKAELYARMADTYSIAKEVSDEAYLFVTPVYIPGVMQAGRDAENVRQQFDFAQSACIDIAGERCIQTQSMLDGAVYYSNLTHLGAAGARELARLTEMTMRR